VAGGHPQRRTAAARAQRERSVGTHRQDGNHRVGVARAPDAVTVPGDRVVPVAIEAQAGCGEVLAELGAVVRREHPAGLVEHGMGERLALVIEAGQARHIDDRVVHLASLSTPRHHAAQVLEQLIAAAEPARPHVQPRSTTEVASGQPIGDRPQRQGLLEVEERALPRRHGPTLVHESNSRSTFLGESGALAGARTPSSAPNPGQGAPF
jgi:hypothetical protein